LQNAFIQALIPSIDHAISLKSVDSEKLKEKENLFQRIFKPEKNKDKKKK